MGDSISHKPSVTTFLCVLASLLLSDICILLFILHSSEDIKTYLHKQYVHFSHLKHCQCSISQFSRQNTWGFLTLKPCRALVQHNCLERNVKQMKIKGSDEVYIRCFIALLYIWNRTSSNNGVAVVGRLLEISKTAFIYSLSVPFVLKRH